MRARYAKVCVPRVVIRASPKALANASGKSPAECSHVSGHSDSPASETDIRTHDKSTKQAKALLIGFLNLQEMKKTSSRKKTDKRTELENKRADSKFFIPYNSGSVAAITKRAIDLPAVFGATCPPVRQSSRTKRAVQQRDQSVHYQQGINEGFPSSYPLAPQYHQHTVCETEQKPSCFCHWGSRVIRH